jgi:hypothetical protein
MTLWDQLDGRTWSQRAGPRSADAKPARRRPSRRHHLARSRLKARIPRHAGDRGPSTYAWWATRE